MPSAPIRIEEAIAIFTARTISHLVLNLTGDVCSHDLGVEFRTLDLVDVDRTSLSVSFFRLILQIVDVLTAFADRPCRDGLCR